MDNLEQIEHLLGLFDQREKLKVSSTRKIFRFVNDTLLKALIELLGLPNDAVTWDDVYVVDTMMAIKMTIEYNPSEPMTPFLSLISISNPSEPLVKIHRTLQLGIPLPTIFLPSEQIKMWLMEMATETFGVPVSVPEVTAPTDPVPAPTPDDSVQTSFDPTPLTQTQISQLLYFQQQTKGIKQ